MDYKKRINKLKNPKNILDVFLSVGKKSKSYKGRIRDIKETSENKNILKVYLKKLEKPARDIKELSEELERIQKANKKAVKEIDKKTSSFSKKGHEHKNFLTKKEHKQGQKITQARSQTNISSCTITSVGPNNSGPPMPLIKFFFSSKTSTCLRTLSETYIFSSSSI